MGKILHAYTFACLDNEGFKYLALMTANSKKSEIYYPMIQNNCKPKLIEPRPDLKFASKQGKGA